MSDLFTIIIPTYNHTDTIVYSINSILNQTYKNFEIVVVGDGAPERTNEIMKKLCTQDSRIKYVPHPKGNAHGELYRHEAILNSQGKYICYLCDDDLWLPKHLSTIKAYIESVDFLHSYHTSINPDGNIKFYEGELELSEVQNKMLTQRWNIFGPTCVAHSKEAYLNLPFGWRPRPEGIWSDLYMWRQWLEQKNLKFLTIPCSTTLHFPSPQRRDYSLQDRLEELERYYNLIHKPSYYKQLNAQLINQRKNVVFGNEVGKEYLSSIIYSHGNKFQIINDHLVNTHRQLENLNKNSLAHQMKLSRDYENLKNALSTKLGFILTYPFRKIYDYFMK